jgi:putative flippase GtrA
MPPARTRFDRRSRRSAAPRPADPCSANVQLATFRFFYRVVALDLTVLGIDGWFVVSKVAGIGVGMLVNYVAESLVTWRVGRG